MSDQIKPDDRTEILKAIATSMGQVSKVGKGDRNKHDGYNFASIDAFLELVNPICAENGLIPHMDEGAREDFERKNRSGSASSWMRQSFVITLMHVSGQSLPPVTRTVEVMRNGAQAYGSAQSYALKQFWRSTLLIPTGDKDDADHQATEEGVVTKGRNYQADSEAQAEVTWFAEHLPKMKAPDQINAVLVRAKNAGRDVAKMVADRAKEMGLEYDANQRMYVYLEQADTPADLDDEIPY